MPFFLLICFALISCTNKTNQTGNSLTPDQSWDRGQQIYASNCASCHNMNPKLDGAVGPAVFGSNAELVRARVMKAEYPAGYQAKRGTKTMVALPHLEKEIPNLVEFLSREKTGQ